MNRLSYSVADLLERGAMEQPRELRQLFHQLNNQLGIILAHAELLEKKAADQTSRYDPVTTSNDQRPGIVCRSG